MLLLGDTLRSQGLGASSGQEQDGKTKALSHYSSSKLPEFQYREQDRGDGVGPGNRGGWRTFSGYRYARLHMACPVRQQAHLIPGWVCGMLWGAPPLATSEEQTESCVVNDLRVRCSSSASALCGPPTLRVLRPVFILILYGLRNSAMDLLVRAATLACPSGWDLPYELP